MNSNSEFPEQPKNLPTAGENPNTAGHLDNIPYDKVSMEEARAKGELRDNVDTGELMQVQTGEYWSPRQPAQELPSPSSPETAPKKKNNKLKIILGSVGVAVASSVVYVNAITSSMGLSDTQDKNLPPAPAETSNSANPFPSQSGETQGTPAIEVKFYDENGTEVSKEELSDSVRLTADKYMGPVDAQNGFFEKMEQMMNHLPSDKEVRNNLGYDANKELTKEDYIAAHKIYRTAYDSLYRSPSGSLYTSMNNYADYVISSHYDTRNEEKPYHVSFEPDGVYVLMYDNSLVNSADDQKGTLKYIVDQSNGPEQSLGKDGKANAWLIPGDARFKKVSNQ